MTGVFAGLAVLAFFGWFRTRRFEKVTGPDVAVALVVGLGLYFVDINSIGAAVVVALALTIVAPPRAWVPLAVAGVFEVTLEPWDQLSFTGSENFGWFAYETEVTYGSRPDWYPGWTREEGLASAFAEYPVLPVASLVLALGLLGWAVRRRGIPVAAIAVVFGALAFFSPGSGLLLLATAVLAVVPFGRWYPFVAGGVVLLVPVLHSAVVSVGPPLPHEHYAVLQPDRVWLWLAAIVITTGLVVWSLVRKDFVACVLALLALVVTWPVMPEPEQGMQFLSQDQLFIGPTVWPMVFPAALPALVLLAATVVLRRRN